MKSEKINIYEKVEELCAGFTELLQQLLADDKQINIALSGGTTPNALFNYWAENCQKSIDWKRISFYWGDERCVAPADEMSNYGTARKFLFDKISEIPKENIFRILGENNPDKEAERYGDLLSKNIPLVNEIPSFDLIMLGMGDDGHTASIFPNQINLWNTDANCVVAKHPETGMKRVSLTGRVINNAKNVAFLVTGSKKAEKIQEVIKNRENSTSKYPAALVNPLNGNLLWYLDNAAASLL